MYIYIYLYVCTPFSHFKRPRHRPGLKLRPESPRRRPRLTWKGRGSPSSSCLLSLVGVGWWFHLFLGVAISLFVWDSCWKIIRMTTRNQTNSHTGKNEKWFCGKACGYDFAGERVCWHPKSRMRKHAHLPRNGAMQKQITGKGQHCCIAALFSRSKLNGCVSHAKCQEPTTRHQLWLAVVLTEASLSWLHCISKQGKM